MTGPRATHAEGWEWIRIQRDPCPQCHQHPAALPPGTLGALALTSAAAWRSFLAQADDAFLRRSPAPGHWSPIQYGAHARDMLRVFGDRILLAVAEDNPSVPWLHLEAEERAAYNRLGVEALADDLAAQATRFQAVVAGCRGPDWTRTAMRDGLDRLTVRGLACFGIHEAHHHLLDATGMLDPR